MTGAVTSKWITFEAPRRVHVYGFVGVGVWYLTWRLGTFNPQAPFFSALICAAEVFGFGTALLHTFVCWHIHALDHGYSLAIGYQWALQQSHHTALYVGARVANTELTPDDPSNVDRVTRARLTLQADLTSASAELL